MSNVIPLRQPVAVNPRHPSLHVPKVTLTRRQADLIASLLDHARRGPIDDQGVDAAIELLTGGRP